MKFVLSTVVAFVLGVSFASASNKDPSKGSVRGLLEQGQGPQGQGPQGQGPQGQGPQGQEGSGYGSEGPDAEGSCPKRNNPVCVDGDTYQNSCLAIAQGVTDYTNGPCHGKDLLHFRGSDTKFTGEEMRKFAHENFKMLGQVETFDPENLDLDGEEDDDAGPQDNSAQKGKVTRVDKRGFKYVTKNHTGGRPAGTRPPGLEDTSLPGMQPGMNKNEEEGATRSLSIYGTDTRSIVNSIRWPYWRIGELSWQGYGGCTGTIIGTNKVLTAAHCVYNTYYNQWQVPSNFAPLRMRSSSGANYDPWATWPVEYATIFTAYIDEVVATPNSAPAAATRWDVAVLTMGTNWAGEIGTHMGTLPIVSAPCGTSLDRGSTISGYPADKIDHTMWASGVCPSNDWYLGCGDNYIYHKCDTFGGNSGSAILDSSNRIWGVHCSGGNRGFAFDDWSKDAIYSW